MARPSFQPEVPGRNSEKGRKVFPGMINLRLKLTSRILVSTQSMEYGAENIPDSLWYVGEITS
jgi:hypothetical protein